MNMKESNIFQSLISIGVASVTENVRDRGVLVIDVCAHESVTNEQIARKIWETKSPLITLCGSVSAIVKCESSGLFFEIRFNRTYCK